MAINPLKGGQEPGSQAHRLTDRAGRTALQKGMRRPTNKNAVLGWLKEVLDVGKTFSRREERRWLDIIIK